MTATRAGLVAVALVTALAAAVTGQTTGYASAQAQPTLTGRARPGCTPRGVLAHLDLAQRVGQLFVEGVDTDRPTAFQERMIRRHHLGGAVLVGHSNAGTAATWRTTRALQRQARSHGVSLWVAADQEGGSVQVLHGPGFAEMPTALHQGSWRPSRLRSRAHRWGTQLTAAGVNLDLAPVLDTVPAKLGRGNAPIGAFDREYAQQPGAVSAHALAVRRGMRAAGVQTTAKHFPGLGRVRNNTDTSFGVRDDVTTRNDRYLRPFRAAVDDGIPVVMVSSARYTRIDRRFLAPFAPRILRGMLRHDLGFQGVVISDDLGAARAVSRVPVANRAVRFLRAGGTVVLTVEAATIPTMTRAVRHRARTVPAFRHTVDTAALRVLQAKRRAGLLGCQHTGGSSSDPGLPGGTARFQAHGEHVYLCDRQRDGLRVVARVRTSDGATVERHDARGVGTCDDEDLTVPEGGWVRFQVCLRDGADGRDRHCGGQVRSSARG